MRKKKDTYRLPNVNERKRRSIDRRSVSSDLGAISSLTFRLFNIDRINFLPGPFFRSNTNKPSRLILFRSVVTSSASVLTGRSKSG